MFISCEVEWLNGLLAVIVSKKYSAARIVLVFFQVDEQREHNVENYRKCDVLLTNTVLRPRLKVEGRLVGQIDYLIDRCVDRLTDSIGLIISKIDGGPSPARGTVLTTER